MRVPNPLASAEQTLNHITDAVQASPAYATPSPTSPSGRSSGAVPGRPPFVVARRRGWAAGILVAAALGGLAGFVVTRQQGEVSPSPKPDAPVTAGLGDTKAQDLTVKRVVITGNRVVPTKEILKVVTLRPGDAATSERLGKDREAIRDLYRKRGYVADVQGQEPDQLLSPDGTLTFPIIEATIESIEIKGNKKTKTDAIRRRMRSKPGQAFNQRQLQKDLENIHKLGAFEEVGPLVTELGSEPGKIILRIPVKEK